MQSDPIGKRWAEAPPESGTLEGRAAGLMRRAGSSEALPPARLASVWAQVEPTLEGGGTRWLSGRWPFLFGLAGAVVAGWLWWLSPQEGPHPAPSPTVKAAPAAVAPTASVSPPVEVAPAPVPARTSDARRPAPPTPVAPASTDEEVDPLEAESLLLSKAVRELRRDQDARAALGTLEEYARRFPEGVLGREASITRIEALLALGQRPAALELLEKANLDGLPRADELTVLRAELLAENSRCADAVIEFSRALAAPRNDSLQERALYGRAVCRGRLHDEDGRRQDLLAYLARFPEGRFAASVREHLDLSP